ncbi:ABC transporter permease [Halochromatium salexigens]|uniref:ABC transporter permease n=1 Tax=Halochromatium salexigens TaxID=49447 RepID=A0AAJ0UGY5_HALSE|nr:FtsX-like permease family protein [Halochromatium salexigens]MBK5931272.1 ABC transporter permease [Halochromatium salexigens]
MSDRGTDPALTSDTPPSSDGNYPPRADAEPLAAGNPQSDAAPPGQAPSQRPAAAGAAWRLAARLLRRDWRSGELYLLAGALILTVAAITAVGFFTDRIEAAMQRQGSELLAADLALEASTPIPAALADEANQRGLELARTLTFRSVVFADETSQLVQVKAVDDGYPLRGRLRLRERLGGAETEVPGGPPAGEVWIESRLLHVLGKQVGDRLTLGERALPMRQIIAYEPDRGGNIFQIAPRVMMAMADVEATGLVGEASRARHRLLIAGDADAVADYRDWLADRLPTNAELIDARNARPEFESAVDRASRFLHLAALTTLLVAGAAMALASRRLVERQTDAVAVMRCLGAPRHLLTQIFALRLLLFGLIAGLLGVALGWLAQFGLAALLADWFDGALPPAGGAPALVGLGTGLVALAGFGLPPLLQLADVPPLRVLRRDLGPPKASVAISAAGAVGTLALLILWQAGDTSLAWKLLGGVAATVVALGLSAGLLVWLARLATNRARGVWRLGLAGLSRRPTASILSIVGLGLGILALLLLAVVRLDLLRSWQETLPEGAPNRFLINIQPSEVDALEAFLRDKGLDSSGLYPMIRGRLRAIGGEAVDPEAYDDPQAQRLAEREFNLSFAVQPQSDNEIVAGRWWAEVEAPGQFSVEEGIAETLGIDLGEELRFWVAGREVSAPVTSLRQVQWDSFNVNFFVIAPPALLAAEPATYVTSFYLPPGEEALATELIQAFPSVTLIDVGALLQQVQGIIRQGIQAVEYVFLFTLLAGLLVMYAGIQASLAVRRAEHGVLRALGAQRRQLLVALAVELTTAGLLAGLIASLFAELTGWVLARELFGLPFAFSPWLWIGGVLGSGLLVGAAGTLGTYRLLVRPPLSALRQSG